MLWLRISPKKIYAVAWLCSLAVVMSELVLRLQSARVNRGLVREVRSSGHSVGANVSAVAYDKNLLACEQAESTVKSVASRIIIQDKDKLIVNHLCALVQDMGEPRMNCKTFTPPPKPSSVLNNLTTLTLSDDVIGRIGSFNHDVHCNFCQLWSLTSLEQCRPVLSQHGAECASACEPPWHFCSPTGISVSKEQTLQTCMTSPKANEVAVCHVGSDGGNLHDIEIQERAIQKVEDTVQASKGNIQVHLELIKEEQEFIKKMQENITALQDVLDMRKQNIVYLKHIF